MTQRPTPNAHWLRDAAWWRQAAINGGVRMTVGNWSRDETPAECIVHARTCLYMARLVRMGVA